MTNDHKWKINTTVGRYFKIPTYPILGYQSQNKFVNVTSQYTQCNHLVMGIEYNPNLSSVISLEAYTKAYTNYPVSLMDNIALANKGTEFEVLGNEAIESIGIGKSSGIEFWYQKKLSNRIYSSLTYSYFVSEFGNLNSKELLPSIWDSRYIVSLTGGYKFKKNWEFSIRYRQTGATPYALADERASIMAYPRIVYDYSTLRENSIEGFKEGNFRIDKRWNRKQFAFNFYFEVFNFLGQKMQLADRYALNRYNNGTIVEPKELIRFKRSGLNTPIPSLGFVVDF